MRLILFITLAVLTTVGLGFLLFSIEDPFAGMMSQETYDLFSWSYLIVFPGLWALVLYRLYRRIFSNRKTEETEL